MARAYRIGVIGCGYLGRSLYERFRGDPVSVVAIYDRNAHKLAAIDPACAVSGAESFIEQAGDLDLVVEVAHPSVTQTHGEALIAKTSYMPCSVVALADESLRARLLEKAETSGTRLYVPHGAAVGLDNLLERRDDWERVEITFRKPPSSIDAEEVDPGDEVVLFEGTVREIADKFPRSVNAMVTCAIATVGLDATIARFVADRTIGNRLRGEFEFRGKDGSRLAIVKEEPAVGVTSTGMVNSIAGSILRALAAEDRGLHFV